MSFFLLLNRIFRNFAVANAKSPDGGIGRRVGLKHQWSNPCRFDPGSGYRKKESSDSFFCFVPDVFWESKGLVVVGWKL